jgi:hypothetical protein
MFDNKEDLTRIVNVLLLLLGIVVIFNVISIWTGGYARVDAYCQGLGYGNSIYREGQWFCADFTTEPRILHLGDYPL